MSVDQIKAATTSNTIVILGSGPSINDLDDKFWQFCETCDTLAINNWIYHKFVPTFWSLDARANVLQIEVWKHYLHSRENNAYQNVIWLVVQEREQKARALLSSIGLSANMFLYKVNLVHTHQWSTVLNETDMLFGCQEVLTCMDASLPCLLSLVYQLGYTTIILAGIDLYNSLYFWSDYDTQVHKRFNGSSRLTLQTARTQVHNTQSPAYHVTRIVTELNDRFFKRKNISLYVTSKKSCLYPAVKYFDLSRE